MNFVAAEIVKIMPYYIIITIFNFIKNNVTVWETEFFITIYTFYILFYTWRTFASQPTSIPDLRQRAETSSRHFPPYRNFIHRPIVSSSFSRRTTHPIPPLSSPHTPSSHSHPRKNHWHKSPGAHVPAETRRMETPLEARLPFDSRPLSLYIETYPLQRIEEKTRYIYTHSLVLRFYSAFVRERGRNRRGEEKLILTSRARRIIPALRAPRNAISSGATAATPRVCTLLYASGLDVAFIIARAKLPEWE